MTLRLPKTKSVASRVQEYGNESSYLNEPATIHLNNFVDNIEDLG